MAQASSAAEAKAAARRELVFQDGKSNKFWNIELDGSQYVVRFGRVGTAGQQQVKEFADDEKARQAFDKLVAEKLKKGYIEAGASSGADVQAPPAAKKKPAAAKQEAAAPAPEAHAESAPASVEATPTGAVDLRIVRELALEPGDWRRAAFRRHEPLERGEPAPFDLDACVARMSKLRTETYGWDIRWRELELPAALTRQEAHFWLEAMTSTRSRDTKPAALAARLAKQSFNGQLSAQDVVKLLGRFDRELPDLLALVLANLLDVKEFIQLAFDNPFKRAHSWHSDAGPAALLNGFAKHILPYLDRKQIAELQTLVAKSLESAQMPGSYYEAFPAGFYLAAALGMHDVIYMLTSSWEDNRYGGEAWNDHYQRPQDLAFGLGTPELVESEWRRLSLRMRSPEHVRAFLACTEYAALDCVRDSVLGETNKDNCASLLQAFTLVNAPEAAAPMLECKLSAKTPGIARDWLDTHVGNAVAGLLETAAGRGKLADAATDYLRLVKRQGYADLIAEALKSVGNAEVAAKVQREVLDREERSFEPFADATTPDWLREELGALGAMKRRALPAWAAVASLPPMVVGDRRLSDEQLALLLSVLAATPVGTSHPLLAALKQHADRQACDEFAWKLFQLWLEDGAPAKEKWAMGAIGHLGGDASALRLTPLVRQWPGESQHQRAVFGLECLRAIGSDVALMQLAGCAQKLKFKGLKGKAEQFVNEIAEQRGMTRAELEDRVIPDCGLDEHGRREFNYGPRSFAFVLGGDLKPAVRDAGGKVRSDLPQPGGKDDTALAEQARADWKLLKKQIKEVATIQAGRLEQAMVTGRRWKVEDFNTLLVRHPLMTHLVRALVWGAFDQQGKRLNCFRVTEERDFADVEDNACTLDQTATVGVLHPLELSEAERAAWGEVLSDYEIVSPFAQFGRAVYALEDDEAEQDDLRRFHQLQLVAPTLVFTLEKLGWLRGVAMDAGCFDEHSKQFPAADVTAVIGYEGTVGMGYIDPNELLKITNVQFIKGLRPPSGYGWDKQGVMKLGAVPPVVMSEVLADLHVLKSKAR